MFIATIVNNIPAKRGDNDKTIQRCENQKTDGYRHVAQAQEKRTDIETE